MINITPDILNRHADHLRYVYDNDESADVMSAAAGRIYQLEAKVARLESRGINDMQHCIKELEADMDQITQITGLLAGLETLFTASEVLALIELLPSVQAAFDRNLGGAS